MQNRRPYQQEGRLDTSPCGAPFWQLNPTNDDRAGSFGSTSVAASPGSGGAVIDPGYYSLGLEAFRVRTRPARCGGLVKQYPTSLCYSRALFSLDIDILAPSCVAQHSGLLSAQDSKKGAARGPPSSTILDSRFSYQQHGPRTLPRALPSWRTRLALRTPVSRVQWKP